MSGGIRRAVFQDTPYFYDICLKTGDGGGDASPLFLDPYMLGSYYAAPYLAYKDGVSYTLEYDNVPAGYIVAAPHTASYNVWLESDWLPALRKRYPLPQRALFADGESAEVNLAGAIHKKHDAALPDYLRAYPAHLHINILPIVQRQGAGRALMEALFKDSAVANAGGIHLGVAEKNTNAIAFYKKIGFTELQQEEWGVVMGYRL